MVIATSVPRKQTSLTLIPAFENVHALLARIHIYVFAPDGRLIQSQAVRKGQATIEMDDENLDRVRVVVSPPIEGFRKEAATLKKARENNVFETDITLEEGQSSYVLPPVPEMIWRWWLAARLLRRAAQDTGKTGWMLVW